MLRCGIKLSARRRAPGQRPGRDGFCQRRRRGRGEMGRNRPAMIAAVAATPRLVKISGAGRGLTSTSFAPRSSARGCPPLGALVLKISQHDCVPVFSRTGHGFIEQRRQLFPDRTGLIGIGDGFHTGLLFALLTPAPHFQRIGGDEARRAIQPARTKSFADSASPPCAPE